MTSIPDTGSIREDLLEHVLVVIGITASPAGRTILRLLASKQPDPEVLAIARSMQSSHKAVSLALLKRAKARGGLRTVSRQFHPWRVGPFLRLRLLINAAHNSGGR